MTYKDIKVPATGAKIAVQNGKLLVPDNPIIPYVEGDGTGRDIWRASVRVLDAAVEKAYKGKRKIHWMEVYAGEKAFKLFQSWHPDETTEAFKVFVVGIKGPLTTPIGGGSVTTTGAFGLVVPTAQTPQQQLHVYVAVEHFF